jgi:hypothetical protein
MSSPTWIPAELLSSARPTAGRAWRVVEAQHRFSTLKLVDTPEDQAILERLIDDTKPTVPPECRHLDYLLFTPFRYGTYKHGSRFRRAGNTEGVFYASEDPDTAIAEIGFYRLLFYAESPDTPWPANPSIYTAFAIEYATDHANDLTAHPLAEHRGLWTDLNDYSHCQNLADAARQAGIEAIRYESVRDPHHRMNIALLRCSAFAKRKPVDRQTWALFVTQYGVSAACDFPESVLGLERALFTGDRRLADVRWSRHSAR